MANEILINATLRATKAGIDGTIQVEGLNVDLTGDLLLHNTISVGSSSEVLPLSEISAGGFILMVNRSTSGYIEVMAEDGETPFLRLNPGEPALCRLSAGIKPYAIATPAGVILEYLVIED